MKRTTIMLPAKLKATAERRARMRGLSLASLIRLSLERELASGVGKAPARKPRPEEDPFLNDNVTFRDNWPGDVSSNLDHYLYGDGRDLP